MDKGALKNLLTDLYEKYNPSHLEYVDDLVERYSESPYMAIDTIFFKYNNPRLPHYDPEKSTDEFKLMLLREYESGNRVFKDMDIARDAQSVKNHEDEKRQKEEEEKRRVEQELLKRQQEIDSTIQKTSKEQRKELEESLQSTLREFEAKVQNIINENLQKEDIDYSVQVDYKEGVILPNKKHLAALGMNARIIAKGEESGKPVGLIIKDITYDCFSFDDKVMVQIFLAPE